MRDLCEFTKTRDGTDIILGPRPRGIHDHELEFVVDSGLEYFVITVDRKTGMRSGNGVTHGYDLAPAEPVWEWRNVYLGTGDHDSVPNESLSRTLEIAGVNQGRRPLGVTRRDPSKDMTTREFFTTAVAEAMNRE